MRLPEQQCLNDVMPYKIERRDSLFSVLTSNKLVGKMSSSSEEIVGLYLFLKKLQKRQKRFWIISFEIYSYFFLFFL